MDEQSDQQIEIGTIREGMDVPVVPARIKQEVIDYVTSNYPRSDNRIWVKEILYCLRKAYFRRVLPDKPMDFEGAWRMYLGLVLHRQFEKLYDQRSYRFEMPIEDTGAVLVGKPDIIENGKIADFKIYSDYYEDHLKKEGPNETDLQQLYLYMYHKNISKGALLYPLSKKWIAVQDITLPGDFNIEHYIRRAYILWKAVKDGVAPSKGYKTGEWECQTCEFLEECASYQEEQINQTPEGE